MVNGSRSRGHVSMRVCHTVCSVSMLHEVITSSQENFSKKTVLFISSIYEDNLMAGSYTYTNTHMHKEGKRERGRVAYTTKGKTVTLLTFVFLCLAHIYWLFCL